VILSTLGLKGNARLGCGDEEKEKPLAAYMEFVRYCPKTTGAYTESA